MKALSGTLWWVLFLVAGITLEVLIPGLDALITGLLLAREENDWKTLVWLAPVCILIQEGLGSQAFGASLVYVTLAFFLYQLTVRLSLSSMAAFRLLFSFGMGALLGLVDWFFGQLQDLPSETDDLVSIAVTQAVYVLIAWTVLRLFRKQRPRREQNNED